MNPPDILLNNEQVQADTVSRELLACFRRHADRRWHFIEPGGNFGDHLIYKGAYKLARAAGLDFSVQNFESFEHSAFGPQDVLYIHGGGGFVPWWSGKPMKMLKKLSAYFTGTLVLGPTTFSNDPVYIKTVFKDCIGGNRFKELFIFTRDRISFDILQRLLPCKAAVALDHDTALNLVKSDLVPDQQYQGGYTLYAMRQDKERPQSQGYDYLRWLDPVDVSSTFEQWLDFHLKAKQIFTNRTHSTILGSILGIPTVMLPNSYHKNRSVWEHSLRQRGVQWIDRLDVPALNRTIESRPFLNRAFSSRKYRKLLNLRLRHFGF